MDFFVHLRLAHLQHKVSHYHVDWFGLLAMKKSLMV